MKRQPIPQGMYDVSLNINPHLGDGDALILVVANKVCSHVICDHETAEKARELFMRKPS